MSGRPRKRYRWWRFIERHLPIVVIYLMVATLVGFLIAPNVIVTVPTGHVGVLWKRFRGGTQLDPRLLKEEGLRVLLPWDQLFVYDLRLQTTTDTYNAISKDGVNLAATINIRFRLKHDAIPQLHQTIGPDYISRLVRPEIGNRAREIIAEYTAEEVYSTKRQEIQKRIRTHTEAMLGQSMMRANEGSRANTANIIEFRWTRCSTCTTRWSSAWSCRRAWSPRSTARSNNITWCRNMRFRVEREKKESERKQIEAEGIRAFQQTVSQGISDSYVRWRGIEATLQLAQSPNTKIVIIGSGKDGLPIILGNVDTPIAPRAAAAPVPDNSDAAKERPAGTSPPLLEKTPASNLATPAERPPPTAVPRAPAEKPPAGGPGATPENAPGAVPGKQSAVPPAEQRSSWAPSLSDIQALVSKVVGQSEPIAPPPPSGGPMPPSMPQTSGGPPHHVPEGPPRSGPPESPR